MSEWMLTDTILKGILYSNLFNSFDGYEDDFQFSLVSQPCMVQFVIIITEKIKMISNGKSSLKHLDLVSKKIMVYKISFQSVIIVE